MTNPAGRGGRRIVAATRGGGSSPAPSLLVFFVFLAFSVCALLGGACAPATPAPRLDAAAVGREELLDSLERRTFDYFWEVTNPRNGLVPDRAPSPSFSSIAAVGFGLTAYPIGVERGWITRDAARERVATTLKFFAAPSGGAAGAHGFYYHFLDMDTGARFKDVELSTIDSAIVFAGALFCQSYFNRDDPGEEEIRSLADSIYRAADWSFWLRRAPLVSMGWTPETGFNDWDWHGLNEGMILYVLALGSPTHAIPAEAWARYTSTYQWSEFYGQKYVQFAPLFGHQYSHVWIDFRGILDPYMREKGIDYFENSRRATYAHRAYAIANPGKWRGYGPNVWGLSACDGPIDGDFVIDGRKRHFYTYAARGASAREVRDDGTIAPTAAVSSIPFAPEIALPAIAEMQRRFGESLYSRYGFFDAFNPTFRLAIPVHHGRVVPGVGWFDTDYLGIDQGPIVAMVENARSELVWKVLRRNPYVVAGLRRAGFTGGWLETAAAAAPFAKAGAASSLRTDRERPRAD
jgi:hypothetical protein